MATKSTKGSLAGGKVKFRVIEFELEGSDESLHDGLKNLAAALLRTGPTPVSRQLSNGSRPAATPDAASVEADEGSPDDDVVDSEIAEPVVKRSPASRKPISVKVLEDIAFDDVDPTLPEFFASKKPSNVLDKYLVIAYWYKNQKKISDLTPDHFHTALRFLNQATPKDAAQPMRDLRHRRRGKFSVGKTPGSVVINHVGENSVREMGKGG